MVVLVEINVFDIYVLKAESEIQVMRAREGAQPSWEVISIGNLKAVS